MTNFKNKILAIVPKARIADFNAWIKENIDPSGNDWLFIRDKDVSKNIEPVGLSPDGGDIPTHAQCNFHATKEQKIAFDNWRKDKVDIKVISADNSKGLQAVVREKDGITFGIAGSGKRLFRKFDENFSKDFK